MSFVPKPGNKVRTVIDLVHLNGHVVRPTHPFSRSITTLTLSPGFGTKEIGPFCCTFYMSCPFVATHPFCVLVFYNRCHISRLTLTVGLNLGPYIATFQPFGSGRLRLSWHALIPHPCPSKLCWPFASA